MPTLPDIQAEMRRLISLAQQQGIVLRAFGGLAVQLLCPSTTRPGLMRQSSDIDLIAARKNSAQLSDFFARNGYQPDRDLNLLNGDQRQLYFDGTQNRQVDILIGDFRMCHQIPLDSRLTVCPWTLPPAELLLTKGQIVQINDKDLRDMAALLLDHPLGDSDEGRIHSAVIATHCGRDWGFFTTFSDNLRRLQDFAAALPLTSEEIGIIQQRGSALLTLIEETPKTGSWKLRARLGRRMRWYEEVEEVQR